MALSNAERQARHRMRVKEKLAGMTAPSADPLRNDTTAREQMAQVILNRLGSAYYDQAEVFRRQISGSHIDSYVSGAIGEFLNERFSFDDIIKMVELAGYARLVEFFRLHCDHSMSDADPPEWRRHADEIRSKLEQASA